MSVLLPTTEVHVLSPDTTLDGHGHAVTYGWGQRGPYPAHVTASGASTDHTERTVQTTDLTVVLDVAAWPVVGQDRLLNAGTGEVYEVTGAVLVPHVPGAPAPDLSHVRATARLLAEASRG